jgi:hypothetical protein
MPTFIHSSDEQSLQSTSRIHLYIMDHRIPWYSIITEIYDKTTSIDRVDSKQSFIRMLGIQYTGFDFNGDTGHHY